MATFPSTFGLFDLTGLVVALTGGYGLLGAAAATGLAAHGATVVVLGRDEAAFRRAFAHRMPTPGTISFVPADVSDTPSVDAALATLVTLHGGLNILINNAYYSKGQQPDKLTDEDFAFGLDGSVGSTYRCIRAALPYLRASRTSGLPAKIINLASMYGIIAPDFNAYAQAPHMLNPPHYGAAKAAVIQLTKYFSSFLGPEYIHVNCIAPGPFPSPTVLTNEIFIAELRQRVPLGRLGEPKDLVGAFVFLASSAADFITGQTLVVDGGWTIR